jgi:hypothetical protein
MDKKTDWLPLSFAQPLSRVGRAHFSRCSIGSVARKHGKP